MIPVEAKPEPVPKFDEKVRGPGNNWLANSGFDLDQPLPKGTVLPPLWRECLDELHQVYGGICAYLCIYIERVTGAVSTNHFVPKSKKARLAYEWSNYRMACLAMNTRKLNFEDVLDPFSVQGDTFRLELVTGKISPNPSLSPAELKAALDTINRLGLDEALCRQARADHYREYVQRQWSADYLRRRSPFVWYEANRQGLL